MPTVQAATRIYDSVTSNYYVFHPETDADMVIGLNERIASVAGTTIILGTDASTVQGAMWLINDD